MKQGVIITAAGSSNRMKGRGKKEFKKIKGRTILERAVLPFVMSEQFDEIVITYPYQKLEETQKALKKINFPLRYIQGGASRQESVFNGLKALQDDKLDLVLIHDGARPFVCEELIKRVCQTTIEKGNCTPIVPSISAMKLINEEGDIINHLIRSQTVAAQTPQGFAYDEIFEAHTKAITDGKLYIDDSEIWTTYLGPAHTTKGDTNNIKITYPEDLKL